MPPVSLTHVSGWDCKAIKSQPLRESAYFRSEADIFLAVWALAKTAFIEGISSPKSVSLGTKRQNLLFKIVVLHFGDLHHNRNDAENGNRSH